MGALLDTPKTDKKSESGEGLGIRYGLSSMQGWRVEMEDAHCAKIGLPYLKNWSFFAVFDGHAGQKASEYCAWNLLDFILMEDYFKTIHDIEESANNNTNNPAIASKESDRQRHAKTDDDNKLNSDQDKNNEQKHESSSKEKDEGLKASYSSIDGNNDDGQNNKQVKTDALNTDKITSNSSNVVISDEEKLAKIKDAIRAGFLTVDEKLRLHDSEDKSGTTAVCALISPTHYFFANCGDSRSVISRNKQVLFSTVDHKPHHPVEKDRIINAGGNVLIHRVNGSLAVSRSLGDFDYKQNLEKGPCEQMVSPEPEIFIHERHQDDEFIVLACDGIWDVMSNIEICDLVRYKLTIEDDLEAICSSVIDICLSRLSRDNMSIIIVVLENGPKKSEEAVARDKQDERWIREQAKIFFKDKLLEPRGDNLSQLKSDFKYDISEMLEQQPGTRQIQPGVILETKRWLIDEIFEQWNSSCSTKEAPELVQGYQKEVNDREQKKD